jgi:hypothetical protein
MASTLVTLFLIPTLYVRAYAWRARAEAALRRRFGSVTPEPSTP